MRSFWLLILRSPPGFANMGRKRWMDENQKYVPAKGPLRRAARCHFCILQCHLCAAAHPSEAALRRDHATLT